MARQGNYVTIPGGGVNFTKDLSRSLSGLSKSLLDQGDKALEREREDALLATENERYKTKQDRLALEQGRTDKEYQLGLDQREAVKNAQFNDATVKAIQTRKARDDYGVTDEQFEQFRDKGLLDIIPVHKEDLLDHYASIHASRFGTPFDPSSVSHLLGSVDSMKERQAREDANAAAEASQLKTAGDYDIRKARVMASLLGKPYSGSSSSTGKSSKALNNINKLGMVQELQGSDITNLWGFNESQQEKGLEAAKTLEDTIRTTYPNLTTAQVNASVVYAMGELRTGANLDHINNDADDMADAVTNSVRGITDNPSRYGFNSAGSIDFGSAEKFKVVTPRNIKAETRERVRKELDELFGRTSTQASATSGSAPPASTQRSGAGGTTPSRKNLSPSSSPISASGTGDTTNDNTDTSPVSNTEQTEAEKVSRSELERTQKQNNINPMVLADDMSVKEAKAILEKVTTDDDADIPTGLTTTEQIAAEEVLRREQVRTQKPSSAIGLAWNDFKELVGWRPTSFHPDDVTRNVLRAFSAVPGGSVSSGGQLAYRATLGNMARVANKPINTALKVNSRLGKVYNQARKAADKAREKADNYVGSARAKQRLKERAKQAEEKADLAAKKLEDSQIRVNEILTPPKPPPTRPTGAIGPNPASSSSPVYGPPTRAQYWERIADRPTPRPDPELLRLRQYFRDKGAL